MDNILKKAALQELCDFLGFDEGKVYFSLLNKEKSEGYSHSKSYRIFKSLYNLGAVAKLNQINNERDFLTYAPLPPTFLHLSKDKNQKVLDYLEKLYLKNFKDFFMNTYLELSFYWNSRLGIFLVKNFMKDYTIAIFGGSSEFFIYKKNLPPKMFNKIKYFCRRDYVDKSDDKLNIVEPHLIGNRRIILIDGRILFEVLRLPHEAYIDSPEKTKYIGYLLSKPLKIKKGEIDYIKGVEKELKKLLNFS